MNELKVRMNFVANEEDVARMLFSPLFICDGILSQKAFTLEAAVKETYISVLRPAIDSFMSEAQTSVSVAHAPLHTVSSSVNKVNNFFMFCFKN